MIDQNVQLLAAAREQKKVYESSLVQKERQITKLDTAFKTASQEVLKVWLTLLGCCNIVSCKVVIEK